MSRAPHRFLSLPGLPERSLPLLQGLLLEPPVAPSELRYDAAKYRRLVQSVACANNHADALLACDVAERLDLILARVDARTGIVDLSVIMAAVLYFVVENDDEATEPEAGDCADVRVVNAMLRWLGRDDLMLRLPAPIAARLATPPELPGVSAGPAPEARAA
jgi:hypothetical protein